jgi:hypothetical protein
MTGTAEGCRARLERAGWSLREGRGEDSAGAWWWAAGSLGGAGVVALCATRGDAWQAVCDKAGALGLLPPE